MLLNIARVALSIVSGWAASVLVLGLNLDRVGSSQDAHHIVILTTWLAVSSALIALSIRKGE